MIKKKRKKHRHNWQSFGDTCWDCGAYEAYCEKCKKTGYFTPNGKLAMTE